MLPSTAQLEQLRQLGERAGAAILAVRDRTATLKEDGTPVTKADFASNEVLMAGIREILGPQTGILSEEVLQQHPDEMVQLRTGLTVVIDPLDGTTNFNNNSPEYSVLMALLMDSKPVYGFAVMPEYKITVHGGTLTGQVAVYHHDGNKVGTLDDIKKLTDVPADVAARSLALPLRFWQSPELEKQQHMRDWADVVMNAAGNRPVLPAKTIFSGMLPYLYPEIDYRMYRSFKPSDDAGDWDLAVWNAMALVMGGCLTNLAGQELRYLTGNKHSNYIYHRDATTRAKYQAEARTQPLLRACAYS